MADSMQLLVHQNRLDCDYLQSPVMTKSFSRDRTGIGYYVGGTFTAIQDKDFVNGIVLLAISRECFWRAQQKHTLTLECYLSYVLDCMYMYLLCEENAWYSTSDFWRASTHLVHPSSSSCISCRQMIVCLLCTFYLYSSFYVLWM